MKLRTLFGLIASGQLSLLLQMQGLYTQSYRSSFVAAALSEDMYTVLRDGPASFDQLHKRLVGSQSTGSLSKEDSSKQKFKAWLDMGVSLRELKLTAGAVPKEDSPFFVPHLAPDFWRRSA